jgi:hypothetical protein
VGCGNLILSIIKVSNFLGVIYPGPPLNRERDKKGRELEDRIGGVRERRGREQE